MALYPPPSPTAILDTAESFLLYLVREQPGPVLGCETMLVGCIRAVSDLMRCDPKVDPERARLYPLLKRCMSLLSSHRTFAEVELLIQELIECSCATQGLLTPFGMPLHEYGRSPEHPRQPQSIMAGPPPHGRKLFDALVLLLNISVDLKLSRVHRRAPNLFPAGPADLFPDGEIHGITSVLNWIFNTQAWEKGRILICSMLGSCPGYGMAPFVAIGAPFYTQGLEHIISQCAIIENGVWKGPRPPRNEQEVNALIATIKGMNLLHEILLSAATDAEIRALLKGAGGIALVHTCSSAWMTYSNLELDQNPAVSARAMQDYFAPSAFLWRVFGGRLAFLAGCSPNADPRAGVCDDFLKTVAHERTDRADPYFIAWRAHTWLAERGRCGAPGCHKSESEEEEVFKRCSGCNTVPYCSRECQQAAWNYPLIAHKKQCPKLKNVSLALAKLNWVLKHRATDVPTRLRALPLDQVEGLGAYVDALHQAQYDVQSKRYFKHVALYSTNTLNQKAGLTPPSAVTEDASR